MARMTYDEWKKKKEEPGKGTSESSATAPSSSSTTNGGTSSGRLTYDEWKGNKNSSSLEDWAKSSVSLLNEMQTKSSAWSYKDEHRGYSDQISGLLSQASNWRNQYAGNEEAISYINSVVKALSDTKQKSSRIADSYSKYKTQDEYDTAVREHGYWQEAQGKDYLKLRDEIAKLEPGSEKYEWMKSYAPTTLTKENIDTSLAEVGKEISSLSKFIDEWGNLDVWYNDYVANPSAASYGLTDDQVQERVSMHKAITNRFGSYDNMRATLEAKKEELRNLENHQKYGLLEQNKDFRAVSSDVATELPSGLGMFTADSTYYYINDVDGYRMQVAGQGALGGRGNSNEIYGHMEKEEIARYNYLYNKEGKDSANAYLKYLEPTLNERQQDKVRENAANFANEAGGWASLASIPANLLSIIGLADVAGQSVSNWWHELNTGEYAGPVDFNRPTMTASNFSSSIRETRAEHYNKMGTIKLNEDEHPVLSKILNGKGWGDVYQLGMSMADSLAVGGLTKLGVPGATALLGGSAGTQGMLDALERGATDEQAVTMGVLNAIFETFFEKVSIDHLVDGNTGKIVRDILVQGGVEAWEEGWTTVTNNAADIIVMAEKSVREKTIQAYIDQGLSPEDAYKQALWDEAINLGWDLVGGFLSGGIMGGGSAAIENYVVNPIEARKQANADAESLYGADPGKLVDEALELNPDNAYAQKLQRYLDEGKTLTGAQLNKLAQQNEKAITAQDMTTIQSAAESRLTELGETGDVAAIAAALTKQAAGEKLSKAEQQIVSNSKYGQRVANELNAKNIRSGEYASAWAENIGTERINVEEYSRLVEAAQQPQEAAETTGGKVVTDTPKAAQTQQTGPVEAPAANDQQMAGKLTNEKTAAPEVGNDYAVSADGKAINTATNESATLKGFVSSGGSIAIDTDGGSVSRKNISYADEDQAVLYESILNLGISDADYANSLLKAYTDDPGGVRVGDYVNGMRDAFVYGQNNIPINELMDNPGTAKLTQKQRNTAYYVGKQFAGKQTATAESIARQNRIKARMAEVQEQEAVKEDAAHKKEKADTRKASAKKGGVYYGYDGKTIDQRTGTKLSKMQEVGVDFAKRLAASRGMTIYFYESYMKDGKRVYKDANGKIVEADNGFYDPKTGAIHIDLNAGEYGQGAVLFTIAHELTHFIKDTAPAQYKKLCSLLMKGYKTKGQSVSELVAAQQARAEGRGEALSFDEAYDEVIADSMESILADGQVMELMGDIEAADKGLLATVKKFFRNITKLIKQTIDAYKGVKLDSAEGRMVQQMEDIYDQLQEVFAKGVYEGGEVAGGEQTEIPAKAKRMARNNYDFAKSFADQLIDYQNGNFPADDTFLLGGTPDVLKKIGLVALPMTINQKHIGDAINGTYKGSPQEKLDHIFTVKELSKLPEKIADPIAVIYDKRTGKAKASESNIDVLVEMSVASGKQVIVAVQINGNGHINGLRIDTNKVATVHGNTDSISRLNEAINENEKGNVAVFYINNKKTTKVLQSTGNPIPSGLSNLDGFINSIFDPASPVKRRFGSITESQQFKRWFGDWQNHSQNASKIVNLDGTPKIMYHGSPAKFSIFDKTKAKYSGLYGRGFYFTDSESHAETYGQKYAVYLNIKNPLQSGLTMVSKSQVQKFLEAVAENEDYSIENYGSYAIGDVLQQVMGKDYKADAFRVIQDISATAIGDMVEAVELFNQVNGTQYDGIIVPTEVVAFYPEQIKSATDNIGTFDGTNPDIRRSARSQQNATVGDVLKQENEQLKADVEQLREMLKLQRTVTNGTKFTKTSVEAAARLLMRNANAKGDVKELAGLLNDLYEHIAGGKELTWESVKEAAQPAVDWLQDHVQISKQRSEYANDILRDLRTSRVYLDDTQVAEVEHRYGSYNNFRKAAMGSIIFAKDRSISLDSKWQELAELYPDVFDMDMNAADMPEALMGIISSLRDSDTSVLEYEYNRDMIAQDLLRQVYDSYWRVSTLRTFADRQQAKIDQLKDQHASRMAQLREESRAKIDQMKADHRAALERQRQKHTEAMETQRKKIVEQHKESRKKAVEGREKTAVRHKIQRVVAELNGLLLTDDKKRHVPDSLKKAVAEALSLVNMDTVGAEERIARYEALIANETDQDKIDAYTVTMENIKRQGEKIGQRLKELRDAYEEIANSDDPDIANAYDPVISGSLAELSQSIGDTSLKDMSLAQLEDVYDMYKMVLTRVRDANKSLIETIQQTITERAANIVKEVQKSGDFNKLRVSGLDPVRSFSWNNLKPVYAMERIGSATMTEAYNHVRAGEDTWAKDVTDARAFYAERSKKYGCDGWDFEKTYSFNSASGQKFDLTLEQIMSLYAYSKRDQALDHLRLGGFVFDSSIEVKKERAGKNGKKHKSILKYKINTADAHQLSAEILADIVGTLSDEQRGFVDEMQEYLSTTMGAKGNEVTMKMYGVKLFREKFYFPLKSAKQFMFEQNEVSGEVRIKNSGFTNKAVPNANNPVILDNFMDVWAGHVNDMSMYHAFVLPLEDFNRLFNFNSPKQEGTPSVSVKGTIQNAYSPAAVSYLKQLITDLNGGAVADPRETPAKAMLAKFKKAKVFASLSVVIQQPSAIGRAFALVHPKYFRPTKDGMTHKQLWDELKQYAPVAIIKEMGYFDTNLGRSTLDYIKAKEYSKFKEKAKAVFTDSSYRDEVLSKAPALADELTWCAIWNAVKRETMARNHDLSPRSEEFLSIAGTRFTEVVTKTQVYDSVLARSANMRSKSGLMSMATSFMAEPTTTINMLEDAVLKAKRGHKKYAAKVFASVAVSVVLNNALVSLIYAMRDDDEEETYAEKYAQAFVSGMLDNLNPVTYYPYLKDMWSLLQGFDVERSDLSLVADFADAAKKLVKEVTSEDGDLASAWWDLAGAVANIGGIPIQNIRRDTVGAINFVKTLIADHNGRETTAESMSNALAAAVRDSLPVVGWLPGESKSDKICDALTKGDTVYAERLRSGYSDEKAWHTAVRKAMRDGYEDGRIDEETAVYHLVKDAGMAGVDAVKKVNYWVFQLSYPENDVLTEGDVEKYYEYAEPVNIDLEAYESYCAEVNSGMKKNEVLAVIDSLELSTEQKDALYYASGYAESRIGEAPWY